MSVSGSETQVQWGGANSQSVGASGNEVSDDIAGDFLAGTIVLKSAHGGTPASGDTVDFYLLASNGDPDGVGTDEFTTQDIDTAHFLVRIDHNSVGATVLIGPIALPVPVKNYRIWAVNNGATSVTVSAILYKQEDV